MKILRMFLSLLVIMLAAMFYTPIALALPMQAEYHAMQSDNGFVSIAMTAPILVVSGMVALGFSRIMKKSKFTKIAAGGDGDDEQEITARGGGVVFRS